MKACIRSSGSVFFWRGYLPRYPLENFKGDAWADTWIAA